jgi:MFS family permease
VAGGLLLAVAALALTGITGDVEEMAALTSFQHRLPTAAYGRFFSLFLMATGLGGVIGSLLGPLLAEWLGVAAALAVLATPVVAAALTMALEAWRLDRPGPVRALAPPMGLEPEVVGFGMFEATPDLPLPPDPSDLRPGTLSMRPRLSRLA